MSVKLWLQIWKLPNTWISPMAKDSWMSKEVCKLLNLLTKFPLSLYLL